MDLQVIYDALEKFDYEHKKVKSQVARLHQWLDVMIESFQGIRALVTPGSEVDKLCVEAITRAEKVAKMDGGTGTGAAAGR